MRRLSKIVFAILIGLSFVAGSATASPSGYRHRRHGRGFKHAGKRIGHGGKRFGKGVGRTAKEWAGERAALVGKLAERSSTLLRSEIQ